MTPVTLAEKLRARIFASTFARPVVAVDPGVSGAVARIDRGELTIERDFKELSDICEAIARQVHGPEDLVVMELVHAMPGEGVCSVFSFGRSTGVAMGCIETLIKRRPVEIAPQRWQNYWRRELGLPQGVKFKELTRVVAESIFKGKEELFKRKKDHNSADAALLATYAALVDL